MARWSGPLLLVLMGQCKFARHDSPAVIGQFGVESRGCRVCLNRVSVGCRVWVGESGF